MKHRILHDSLGRAWIVPAESWEELYDLDDRDEHGARRIERMNFRHLDSPTDLVFENYEILN